VWKVDKGEKRERRGWRRGRRSSVRGGRGRERE